MNLDDSYAYVYVNERTTLQNVKAVKKAWKSYPSGMFINEVYYNYVKV